MTPFKLKSIKSSLDDPLLFYAKDSQELRKGIEKCLGSNPSYEKARGLKEKIRSELINYLEDSERNAMYLIIAPAVIFTGINMWVTLASGMGSLIAILAMIISIAIAEALYAMIVVCNDMQLKKATKTTSAIVDYVFWQIDLDLQR